MPKYIFLLIFLFASFSLSFEKAKLKHHNKTINYYFYTKSLIFSKKMITKEKILLILLENIKQDMHELKVNNVKIDLPNKQKLQEFQHNFTIQDMDLNQPLYQVSTEIEQREIDAYNIKLLYTRMLKSNILRQIPKELIIKIFKRDYKQAMQYYAENKYEIAFWLLDELQNHYSFKNIADILFLQAECLLQMSNIDEAVRIYRRIITNHHQSPYYYKACKRLVLVLYNNSDFRKVISNYSLIEKNNIHIDDNFLLAIGISFFKENKMKKAIEIFDKIQKNSEAYIKALYFKGHCLAGSKKFKESENILLQVVQNTITSDNNNFKKLMHDDSLLKLGYIKFEELENQEKSKKTVEINKAISYLDMISSTSTYYEKALIAKSWIFHKYGNFQESNNCLQKLITSHPNTEYIFMAQTLKGFNNELLEMQIETKKNYLTVLETYKKYYENNKKYLGERLSLDNSLKKMQKIKDKLYQQEGNQKELLEDYFNMKYQLLMLMDASHVFLQQIKKDNDKIGLLITNNYQKQKITSIQQKVKIELTRIKNMKLRIDEIYRKSEKINNIHTEAKVINIREEIASIKSENDKVTSTIRNISDNLETNIELSKWSDLAFMQYAFSILEFRKIEKLQEQLEKCNDELNKVRDHLETLK